MKAADSADTVLERLQAAWQMQPDGERQFFGITAGPTHSTTTFRWANYLAGTGGLLGNICEGDLQAAVSQVLARLGQLRETCRRGSLLRPEAGQLRRRPQLQPGARKKTASA